MRTRNQRECRTLVRHKQLVSFRWDRYRMYFEFVETCRLGEVSNGESSKIRYPLVVACRNSPVSLKFYLP